MTGFVIPPVDMSGGLLGCVVGAVALVLLVTAGFVGVLFWWWRKEDAAK